MTTLAILWALTSPDTDRAALTKGVTELIAPGALPGPMVAQGANAFVVLRAGDSPLFVAGSVERGKAVAGGHGGFFGVEALKNPSNATFLTNCLTWLGGRPLRGLQVGVLDSDGVLGFVNANGGTAKLLDKGLPLRDQIRNLDVVYVDQSSLDGNPMAQAELRNFVRAGKGLLTAGCAWGWVQLNPGKSLRDDQTGNRLLLPFGIGFSDGTVDGPYVTAGAENPLLQTQSAFAALREGKLAPKDTAIATGSVQRALSLSSTTDSGLVAEIEKLAKAEGAMDGPTKAKPITNQMPFSRLNTTLEAKSYEFAPVEKIKAHPSAKDFPGVVDPKAVRVNKQVQINLNVPEWHGVGLYAPPGEVVTIRIPTDATKKGLGVRIGSHTDETWHLAKWERFPSISRQWPLSQEVTRIATPFGGTIFIDVPGGRSGEVEVRIERAVPAPHFVLGETTNADWAKMVATPGGPWVELEGKLVTLSVPRYAVKNLKDPESLMKYWDEVMGHCYDLYAAPRRSRPERYCVDRQISAGYMHSGYPIMTFEDVAETFVDEAKLRGKGKTWGFYHEMGHNFQEGPWTFDGTGEVTNNLFSLYGSEKLNGITPDTYGEAHPAMEKVARNKRVADYIAAGADFNKWKSDPFLALTMYTQMREAFGWEPFTKVFGEYRTLTRGQLPKNELEQHSQWMVRMSRATGRNLGPFFKAWGMPVTPASLDSIKNLPDWMPADWPK